MSYVNKEKHNACRMKEYNLRKDAVFFILGGNCTSCGSNENLEIDHIDPSRKEFNISRRLHTAPWPIIWSELKKCQSLCTSCHKAKTFKGMNHGTVGMYSHGRCRCAGCRSANRKYMQAWRNRKRTRL